MIRNEPTKLKKVELFTDVIPQYEFMFLIRIILMKNKEYIFIFTGTSRKKYKSRTAKNTILDF